jgi:hypothetical protein
LKKPGKVKELLLPFWQVLIANLAIEKQGIFAPNAQVKLSMDT